jgi:hypothetical protein
MKVMTRKIPYSQATPTEIVDHALRDAGDINVVVGPLCWRPTDGILSLRPVIDTKNSGVIRFKAMPMTAWPF